MEELQSIAQEATTKFPDDIATATAYAIRRAKAKSWFMDCVDELVSRSIRAMICDFRHTANVAMRKEAYGYGGSAKVVAGSAVAEVASSYYGYLIAGMSLGTVTGDQLPAIAESESANAAGHEFNARLCRALRPLVPDEKAVRDCVSERRLRTLFIKLSGREEAA
jgi:hypothetical protein